MKALTISPYGEADMLKFSLSAPKPATGPGQALVRIHAAGVNFVDIYQRRGDYPVNTRCAHARFRKN
jgi:NADPH2:quinone reductase